MYTAEKDNKVYTITELEVEYYQKQGFDIFDENHELHSNGISDTVSGERYLEALNRIDELTKQNEETIKEKDELIEALNNKIDELNKQIEELTTKEKGK